MTHGEGPPVVTIYDETDDLVTVRTGDGRIYDVVYDDYTGDWSIGCGRDDQIQDPWLRSRDGAIQYVLDHLDVIEDGDYERAPERC